MFHLNVKDALTGLKVFGVEAVKPVAHLIRTYQEFNAYDIRTFSGDSQKGFFDSTDACGGCICQGFRCKAYRNEGYMAGILRYMGNIRESLLQTLL
ncbi:MAG: hypothetical protein ACLR7D_08725 [Lachnospira eligens]